MLYQHYMAASDVTLTQFHAEIGAMKTALRGGNFAAARLELSCASMSLKGLMIDHAQDGKSYSLQKEMLEEGKKAIDLAERAATGGGATQIVPVQFGRLG